MGDGSGRSRRSRRHGEGQAGHAEDRGSLRPPRIKAIPEPRLSRSLEYGLAMLESFGSQLPLAGVVDLAAALSLGRSTAHRYASTLHALGCLEQDENRKYRLSGRALEPAISVLDTVRGCAESSAVLAHLRERSGHTAGLAALDGARAVYIERLHAHRAGQYAADLDLRAGASVPLHCTAIGKALIASLPEQERSELIGALDLTRRGPGSTTSRRRLAQETQEIAAGGLSLSDEEQAAGVRSVAVAVQASGGPWPLAIDVTVPASTWTMARIARELGPLVREAAAHISEHASHGA
jgi:DNA-binding IclR family transcriptional regulator